MSFMINVTNFREKCYEILQILPKKREQPTICLFTGIYLPHKISRYILIREIRRNSKFFASIFIFRKIQSPNFVTTLIYVKQNLNDQFKIRQHPYIY
jgi:hypothetical protein